MVPLGALTRFLALWLSTASFAYCSRVRENPSSPSDNGARNSTFGIFTHKLLKLPDSSNSVQSVRFIRPTMRELLTMAQVVSTPSSLEEHAIRHGRHRNRHLQLPNKNATVPQPTSANSSLDISVVSLGSHAHCYNSNEVLEIIGVTCLVNFAFWSLILACVHLHTRTHQPCKTDSCESLVATEDLPTHTIINETSPLGRRSSSCRSVEHYLESLPADFAEEENPFQDPPWRENAKGRPRRLSNMLTELISLDNLQPRIGRWHSDQKTHYLSLSMENLIF